MADNKVLGDITNVITTPQAGDLYYVSRGGVDYQIAFSNLVGGATQVEIGYLSGVTSAIQTQLNTKAPLASPTFTGTITMPVGLTGIIRTDTGVVSVDTTEHNTGGTHKAALVTTLKATGAEVNTGTNDTKIVTPKAIADSNYSAPDKVETLTNKTLISPVVNTGVLGTAISTGAEVTTGTNNTKIVTPKAIADAGILATQFATTGMVSDTTANASYEDFAGATLTINPTKTVTVQAIITGRFFSVSAAFAIGYQLLIDGTVIQNIDSQTSAGSYVSIPFALSGQASVASGARIIKMQIKAAGGNTVGFEGNLNIIYG